MCRAQTNNKRKEVIIMHDDVRQVAGQAQRTCNAKHFLIRLLLSNRHSVCYLLGLGVYLLYIYFVSGVTCFCLLPQNKSITSGNT